MNFNHLQKIPRYLCFHTCPVTVYYLGSYLNEGFAQKFSFYFNMTENGTSVGEVGTKGNLVSFGKGSFFSAESSLCQADN